MKRRHQGGPESRTASSRGKLLKTPNDRPSIAPVRVIVQDGVVLMPNKFSKVLPAIQGAIARTNQRACTSLDPCDNTRRAQERIDASQAGGSRQFIASVGLANKTQTLRKSGTVDNGLRAGQGATDTLSTSVSIT